MHYDLWGMFYPKNGKLVEGILSYNFITTSKIRSKKEEDDRTTSSAIGKT